jgi:2-amino-4-hydroxy-6-hydroxymethyldihydropteridine diphosphokinase
MSSQCAVGLGGNLGDPQASMERAVNLLRLRSDLTVTAVSSTWLTEPVGGPRSQNWFLNRVALVVTDLPSPALFKALAEIEILLGRVRGVRFGPRALDLDLLFRDQEILDLPGLLVPHPRLHERGFVLHPLNELAPTWHHPVLGLTTSELLRRLPADGPEVRKLA